MSWSISLFLVMLLCFDYILKIGMFLFWVSNLKVCFKVVQYLLKMFVFHTKLLKFSGFYLRYDLKILNWSRKVIVDRWKQACNVKNILLAGGRFPNIHRSFFTSFHLQYQETEDIGRLPCSFLKEFSNTKYALPSAHQIQ